jgi:hypothetical protein
MSTYWKIVLALSLLANVTLTISLLRLGGVIG